MTKVKQQHLITDQPDIRVDLDAPFFVCSSAGDFSEERLIFLAEQIYPVWSKNNLSLHQLADYLASLEIKLFTEGDVGTNIKNIEKIPIFSFWLRYEREYPGEVLVQCVLSDCERVH